VDEREDNAIRILEYDADWPVRFEILAATLRNLLAEQLLRVEHVGSTSGIST